MENYFTTWQEIVSELVNIRGNDCKNIYFKANNKKSLQKNFMKKEKQLKNFDTAFEAYLSEKDPALHKKAIQELLKEIDLKDAFDELLNRKSGVENFFLMWEKAGKLEKNPVEKKDAKIRQTIKKILQ